MNALLLYFIVAIASPGLQVSSPSFRANGPIPSAYSCEGRNINPALNIKDIPAGTQSLAIIVDGPDATGGTHDHWVAWNISPAGRIAERSKSGVQGKNGSGTNGYTGPCPPNGTHHYHFKVYALDTQLDLKEGASKADLQTAMNGHILADGELIGLYAKTRR